MLAAFCRYTMWGMLALSLCGLATAQDQPNRERQVLRRAQQQVQKLTKELQTAQERLTTAQAEQAKMTEALDGAEVRAGVSSGRAQKLQQQLLVMTAERDALQQQAAEHKVLTEQRLSELNARLSQLDRDLALAQEKGKQLEALRVSHVQKIEACEDRNAKLYAVGRAVVDECRDLSATDTLLRLEPFTGIARVRIENRLESQRDQLDAQRTPPGP